MKTAITFLLTVTLALSATFAGSPKHHAVHERGVRANAADSERHLAIDGYDPVAYFTRDKAVKGSNEHTTKWNGKTWRFATADHLQAFERNPAKYAPEFEGQCAFAVAHGKSLSADPEVWKIVDGQLYLNLNDNIQERWENNQADFIRRAHQNWPSVKQGRG
ncbi:MAG: YHS domain-containing (seleno)protein [Opitutales bacterium]